MLAAAVLAASTGCGTPSPRWILPPPPAEEIRARLGRVVVRIDDEVPAGCLEPPISSWRGAMTYGGVMGMAAVAAVGLAIAGSVGRGAGGGEGACLVAAFVAVVLAATAVLVPAGACLGSLWGLSQGPSGEEIARGRVVLARAVRTSAVADRLRDGLLDAARIRTEAVVAAEGPADTLLLLGRPRVVLGGPWRIDPPLTLHADVRVRLVRVRDGAELYAAGFGMIGSSRPFAEWTADGGAGLVAELSSGTAGFPERIVEEIFLLHPVETPRRP